MSKRIFISYCHKQGDWVLQRLVPVLRAAGAEILIDHERFKAGRAVVTQMDNEQDSADMSLLVLTPDYLASDYCCYEMQRAINRDPDFQQGLTLPVVREKCALPAAIKSPNPLYADLQDDNNPTQWQLVLDACETDLGCCATAWLAARDDLVRQLRRGHSVNLVVPHLSDHSTPGWRALVDHIERDKLPEFGVLDMQSGSTVTRRQFVAEMLKTIGITKPVPAEPDDLVYFTNTLEGRAQPLQIALLRFDIVADRVSRTPSYNLDLFAALRHLITEKRKLVLLIHSRTPYIELLPTNHPLSSITDLKTIELRGQK